MARRKRKDPDDAPIDGDYRQDHTLNVEDGMTPLLVSQEDMPKMIGRGAVRVTRPENPNGTEMRPAYDNGQGADYVVGGQLVLMKIPTSRHEAIQRNNESNFAERFGGERKKVTDFIKKNPGSKYERSHRASA